MTNLDNALDWEQDTPQDEQEGPLFLNLDHALLVAGVFYLLLPSPWQEGA